jgi:hypothetical protein
VTGDAAKPDLGRLAAVTDQAEQLRLRMQAAAAALDFEEARRLRDQISLARGGSTADDVEMDVSGLVRQQPGEMGLGTSRQQVTPPPGWHPPPKPDPMTRAQSRRKRRP